MNTPEIIIKVNSFDGKENLETGVIYKVTNIVNNKIYIGKVFSFEKHGTHNPTKYGANGRLNRHISNAYSDRDDARNECPLFYEAIREYGPDNFIVETLKVCSKKHLKENETKYILQYKSHDPEIGYNFFIGDSKPIDKINKTIYENKKIDSNKKRCLDGSIKQSAETKLLPPNIFRVFRNTQQDGKFLAGYKYQIKIENKVMCKAFTSKLLSIDEKLKLTIEALNLLKQENNLS